MSTGKPPDIPATLYLLDEWPDFLLVPVIMWNGHHLTNDICFWWLITIHSNYLCRLPARRMNSSQWVAVNLPHPHSSLQEVPGRPWTNDICFWWLLMMHSVYLCRLPARKQISSQWVAVNPQHPLYSLQEVPMGRTSYWSLMSFPGGPPLHAPHSPSPDHIRVGFLRRSGRNLTSHIARRVPCPLYLIWPTRRRVWIELSEKMMLKRWVFPHFIIAAPSSCPPTPHFLRGAFISYHHRWVIEPPEVGHRTTRGGS